MEKGDKVKVKLSYLQGMHRRDAVVVDKGAYQYGIKWVDVMIQGGHGQWRERFFATDVEAAK